MLIFRSDVGAAAQTKMKAADEEHQLRTQLGNCLFRFASGA